MNQELPDVQAGFRKGRGTRDQIANIHWIIGKAREFQKNTYFCLITTNWKILQEMRIPNHFTRLLRKLYAGQEATVKTALGTKGWFKIGKRVLHPAYLASIQRRFSQSVQSFSHV